MNATPHPGSLPVIDRELSWLSFNARVLAQGEDKEVPLLERLRFLSIFSCNLDEFYMVRLPAVLEKAAPSSYELKPPPSSCDFLEPTVGGSLRSPVMLPNTVLDFGQGSEAPSVESRLFANRRGAVRQKEKIFPTGYNADTFDLLRQIYARSSHLCLRLERALKRLEEEMTERGILRLSMDQLSPRHRQAARRHFDEVLAPLLIPMRFGPRTPLPETAGKSLYIGLMALRDSRLEPILLPCPAEPGVFLLDGGTRYLLEEEIIEAFCHTLPALRGMRICGRGRITITRGARAPLDEQKPNYAAAVDDMLRQRRRASVTRIEAAQGSAQALVRSVCSAADYPDQMVIRRGGPLSLSYIRPLLSALGRSGRTSDNRTGRRRPSSLLRQRADIPKLWRYPPFQPGISIQGDIAQAVRRRDRLLCYPYQSAEPFLQLMEQAAVDPAVRAIRMTVYRIGDDPRIPDALMSAARHGKSVTVLIELQARFDEKNNLLLASRLMDAGCTVLYGIEGAKVHAKFVQIVYDRGGRAEAITLLGTGNLNPATARQYTDYWLMTADRELGAEAAEWFRRIALGGPIGTFSRLLASPDGLAEALKDRIDLQIERCQKGLPSGIFFKVNSLSDGGIIRHLYAASRAGVPVRLLVRGICCLLPQKEGISETIEVRSIVGRFLEHSRVYLFGSGRDSEVYLSSADLMPRNLHRRAELAFPVDDPILRQSLLRQMELYWNDNVKARRLCSDGVYRPLSQGESPLDAQAALLESFCAPAIPDETPPVRTDRHSIRNQ